jgi:hypothetical protein
VPLSELYQVDFRIFMAAASAWLAGRSPYGPLSSEFSRGAFAYPPTALPWLALLVPTGALGFYLWTLLELLLLWLLVRKDRRSQLVLLVWSPMILHLYEGQSTLAVALVVWACARAERRGIFWGLALAWALTKPQVALLPVIFLLCRERHGRFRLLAGILGGTLALALPATLMHPGIWSEWLASLSSYRGRLLQVAPWQGASALLVLACAVLWYRYQRTGLEWWLSAALFPQTSFYSMVVLLPALRPNRSYWSLGGLALAAALQGPINAQTLSWVLAGHLLAAWMIAGGASSGLVGERRFPGEVSPEGHRQEAELQRAGKTEKPSAERLLSDGQRGPHEPERPD